MVRFDVQITGTSLLQADPDNPDNAYKQTLADLENKAKEAAETKRLAILDAENAKKSALEKATTQEEIENAKKAADEKRKQAEKEAAEEEEKLARKASAEIENQLQEKLKGMGCSPPLGFRSTWKP